MTRIAILPVTSQDGMHSFLAIAGAKHCEGATAGAALDALASQLSEQERGPLIIVQSNVQSGEGDTFFSASQKRRMEQLFSKWRAARDGGEPLSSDEQVELQELVDQEVQAAGKRAAKLVSELGA